jgi:hypothetical protein
MLKKILNNESGNIVLVIALIGLIAGSIVYWNNLAGKVDTEVRSLGATQSTSYMRADFQNSIKKTIEGTNTSCPTGTLSSFENNFKNYLTSQQDAVYNVDYKDNPATPINEVVDVSNLNIGCFFHPSRYQSLNWKSLKISIKRTSDPNYMTLSNFVAADIQAVFKVSSGKHTVLKYQLKYRIDVLSVNHFGTVFINSQSGPVFELDASSKIKIHSNVLFDVPSNYRNSPYPLSNLMDLPDTTKLTYLKETYTSTASFTSDTSLETFLNTKQLNDVFKKGVEYGHLSTDATFKAPWELSTATQWNDLLDFYPTSDEGYPLPKTTPNSAIYNISSGSTVHTYGGTPNIDTSEIYTRMNGAGNPKKLTKSCGNVTDLSTGIYNLYVFNKLNQDFTIDFTQNTEVDFPPIFCGVMAVNNLIIKMNNQNSTSAFHKHHILGKFIVNGKIKVVGEGELHIHDLMDFNESEIEYLLPDPLNLMNLRTQFYNQKYYSTQNFFLPFFKPGKSPAVGNLMTDPKRFYVPRGTTAFFTDLCAGYSCRVPNIASPDKKDLPTYWQDLMFEVFNVE